MILRRMGADAPSSAEAAVRVKGSPDVEVLQQTDPSTLLVEGHPDSIARVVGGLSGWRALPINKYQIPDTKPRVLKPSTE